MAREDDVRKIVAGGRAKGLSDDQIRALVQRYDARQQAPSVPSTPQAGGMLPTAGGFLGSLAGTVGGVPGRIAGAGIGGALGKGAEMLMDDTDQGFVEGAKAMGAEGLKQAGFEAAGGAIGKGLKTLGGGLYRVALRPSKAVQQEFPNVVQTGLKEALAVTRRGAAKAGERTAASARHADDLLATAERMGAPKVQPRQVISELRPVRDTLTKRADLGLPNEVPALAQRAKTFAAKHQGGIPLTKAQSLKREAQDVADTAFRAQERGAVIKSDEMLANKAMAKGLRKSIEGIVPAVGPVNQRTRDLVGVTQALEDSSARNLVFDRLVGAGAGFAGGMGAGQGDVKTGLTGAALAAGAVSPALLSQLGIGAAKMAPAASFSPQLWRAALLAQLAAETPGEP